MSADSTQRPPALLCAHGGPDEELSDAVLRQHLNEFVEAMGERDDVLILPPDFTRFHSQSGKITRMLCEQYNFIPNSASTTPTSSSTPAMEILPALGTHPPVTPDEILQMYGPDLAAKADTCFTVHDWRNDVVTIGEAPAEMVSKATYGMVEDRPWPAQLNRRVWDKRLDRPGKPRSLVISVGQVVPHEVMGMANFNKNLFVGTGGVDGINLSHFIGAVHGMEKMMGRQNNPLRDILNYCSQKYLEDALDLWYILTVVAPNAQGDIVLRGLYIGRDIACYQAACDLSLQVNFTLLEKPIHRCVAYMEEAEYHGLWVGNKAIYRTRMAMADGGNLIILAPGVRRFGDDPQADTLIRRYGYKGTEATMKAMNENPELQDSLSAVAHLLHGSTDGRFTVTYCPGHVSKEDIEGVGFQYGDVVEYSKRYDVTKLKDGWNMDEEGEFFFISKPALGLWTVKDRLDNDA